MAVRRRRITMYCVGRSAFKLLALRQVRSGQPHHEAMEATDPVAVLPMPQACAAPSAFSPGSREGAATAEWRVRRWRLRGPGSGRRARRRVLRHRNGQSVAPQPRAHHFPPPARFPRPHQSHSFLYHARPLIGHLFASAVAPQPRAHHFPPPARFPRPHQSHSFLYHARPLIGHLFACPVRVLSGIESRSIARRPGASKDGASSWRAASRQLARERDPGSCPRRGQRRSRRWSGTLAHEVSRTPPFPTRTFLPLRTRLEQHSARPPFPSRPSCPFLLGTPQTLPPRVGTRSFRAHRSPSPPARHRCVRPFAFPPLVSCQALGVRTCGTSDGRFY